MLYLGFNILPRSVFWSAGFNGRSDNTDVIQLKKMIRFDLERFVISGRIDPFSFESTRTEIESVLGEADECAYSDFATYGPVCFDLGNGIAPLHRIQILIPHPSHMKPADPAWTNWTPPNFLENWPDERFAWNVGRFKPGFNINDAIRSLPTFEECEMIMSTNG